MYRHGNTARRYAPAAALAMGLLGVFLLLGAAPAREAPEDVAALRAEVAKLKEQVSKLEREVRALKARPHVELLPAPRTIPPQPPTPAPQGPRLMPELRMPEGSVERQHNGLKFYVVPLDEQPASARPADDPKR